MSVTYQIQYVYAYEKKLRRQLLLVISSNQNKQRTTPVLTIPIQHPTATIATVTHSRVGQTSNLLDLVLVNEESLISDIVHFSPVAKSDHETLIFTMYVGTNALKQDVKYRYDLNKGDYERMRHILNEVDWGDIIDGDIDTGWIILKNNIIQCMEQCIQKVKIKKAHQVTPRWINGRIKTMIKNKYKAYGTYLDTNNDMDYLNYIRV